MTERLAAFYQELLKSAGSERRRATVEAVYRAIQRHQLGGNSMTVAAVARTAADFPGAPKEQSIRNDGTGLKALIELAAAEMSATRPRNGRKGRNDDWIERIPDPLIRSGSRGLSDRAHLLEKENDRLRAVILRLEPPHEPGERRGGDVRSPAVIFSDDEVRAVAGFLDSLSSEGFSVETSGELVSRSGRSVAPPGFISALLKVRDQPRD